jgi:hypothetical protein
MPHAHRQDSEPQPAPPFYYGNPSRGRKAKGRTFANLSKLPPERIETLRAALRGDPLAPIDDISPKSAGPCRTAMSSPRWSPPGASAWTICYPPRAPRRRGLAWVQIVAAAKLITADARQCHRQPFAGGAAWPGAPATDGPLQLSLSDTRDMAEIRGKLARRAAVANTSPVAKARSKAARTKRLSRPSQRRRLTNVPGSWGKTPGNRDRRDTNDLPAFLTENRGCHQL